MRQTLDVLAEAGRPLSTAALETRVPLRRARLEMMLKVLDVDGAARREKGGWAATGRPWTYDRERYARVEQARAHEQQAMRRYLAGTSCRMELLRQELDDPFAEPCGRCDVCTGPWYPTTVSEAATATARSSIDRPGVDLEERTTWPTGMAALGIDVKGRIAERERRRPVGPSPGSPTSAGAPGSASSSGRARRMSRPRNGSSAPWSTCSRAGAGSADRWPSWPCRRGRDRCWWPRSPSASRRSASCRCSARWPTSGAARRAAGAATAPTGWPPCGTASSCHRTSPPPSPHPAVTSPGAASSMLW